MLHPSIPVQDIRWSVGTPGRSHIVHFSFKGSPYAILNCYQHTKHKGTTAVEHWATQKQVLDKMSAEIKAVSHRTNLLVTGDFNASIYTCVEFGRLGCTCIILGLLLAATLAQV